MPDGVEAWYVG